MLILGFYLAKLIFTANVQDALYILPNIKISGKHISLYFLNCFVKALDENMYEPKTDAIFLALMLAEKCPLDQVLTDRLQTMFSISSQKDQLEELKLLLHTYKEQQALTEVDISHIVKALVQLFGHESTSFTRILAILMEEQVCLSQ